MKKIVFLDRDGVINRRPQPGEYVASVDEFEILPSAIKGLQLLTKKNFDIFIVTNQAGIGRGLMTENDLQEIHERLLGVCKQNNIHIKKIYYCPHNRDAGCNCRKPKPGMLLQAAREFDFDIKQAIFVGDDERDKQTGDAAGCKTLLMDTDGDLLQIVKELII